MHTLPLHTRLRATGIGFAGIDGAWWLPATAPFVLPATVRDELAAAATAIFLLFDTVTAFYGTAAGAASGLTQLLDHKVPPTILRLLSQGQVEGVRPDFQLVQEADGNYRLVATELEICPSAHGFAHAMQVGYGLPPDLVQMYADYLAGRELIFVGTAHWSEFLIEQLAFCRALAAVGARGTVLYDQPRTQLIDAVEAGQRWQPPIFGVPSKPAGWRADLTARLQEQDLLPYWRADHEWPATVGDAVVFRFGYFDCFSPPHLRHITQWQQHGATLLNPTHFTLESKAILAALQLDPIRRRIEEQDPTALAVLDRCIPPTLLLTPNNAGKVLAEKDEWVVKFAGYDQGQQAWGGRSVQIGAQHTPAAWQAILARYLDLRCPVVAQRLTASQYLDLAYFDQRGQERWLSQGHSRLRVFCLRNATMQWVGGAHLTVSPNQMQVSEATTSVQAPVCWQCDSGQ